jgi:hypothetical protein
MSAILAITLAIMVSASTLITTFTYGLDNIKIDGKSSGIMNVLQQASQGNNVTLPTSNSSLWVVVEELSLVQNQFINHSPWYFLHR